MRNAVLLCGPIERAMILNPNRNANSYHVLTLDANCYSYKT
jgi:hypothetical protein